MRGGSPGLSSRGAGVLGWMWSKALCGSGGGGSGCFRGLPRFLGAAGVAWLPSGVACAWFAGGCGVCVCVGCSDRSGAVLAVASGAALSGSGALSGSALSWALSGSVSGSVSGAELPPLVCGVAVALSGSVCVPAWCMPINLSSIAVLRAARKQWAAKNASKTIAIWPFPGPKLWAGSGQPPPLAHASCYAPLI